MRGELEINLLRSFVAVADHRNFTRAAVDLGRTQSAVSMQLKRLEEIVSVRLFERTKQSVEITAEGETLLTYANRMLRLNDEALSRLAEPSAEGLVRIGALPDDYASILLPNALTSFSRKYPCVQLEVHSDIGSVLHQMLAENQLDLLIATHTLAEVSGEVVRREPLHWIASSKFYCDPGEPLPLVLFPRGCASRDIALKALEDVERAWRIVYTTRSIALIENAVAAGSGVTVMEASTVPEGFNIMDGTDGFPELEDVVISLHRRPDTDSAAVALAGEHLVRELKRPKL